MSTSRSLKRVNPFYTTKEWHKLRARVKAQWKRSGAPCGYCGEPIDWGAKPIVDHIKPRDEYPDLAHDISNLQLVHHGCNTKKSARSKPKDVAEIGPDGFPV